jgi:hypothetical protein
VNERRERLVHPDVDVVLANEMWSEIDSAPDTEESVASILDRNFFETIVRYDPTFRTPRQLDLRINGSSVQSGHLDIGIAKELLGAFQEELSGAAHAQKFANPPRVELAGVSPGSAVLHLVPVTSEDKATEEQVRLADDQLDAMLTTITDLHRVAETHGDLHAFTGHPSLLKGLHNLVATLDRHGLDLDVNWRSGSGVHRTSVLTSRARTFVRAQWADESIGAEIALTGMVVKLDLNGTFSLNTGGSRKRLYEIRVPRQEHLIGLRLNLGDQVSVAARQITRTNRVGISGATRYELIRIISRAEMVAEPQS